MSAASFWAALKAGALRIRNESGAVSPAYPAVRPPAVRGWNQASAAEDREFDGIVSHLDAGDKKAGDAA